VSTIQKLQRPSEDATQEERRSYFTALRKALDDAGIGYGEEFAIVRVGETIGTGPAADSPSANGLGGFARDSATSRKAALDNYPRSGTQRAKVLRAITEAARLGGGVTRDELCLALTMPPNVLTPRVKELIDGGWAKEDPDMKRRTRAGSEAVVVFATDKAMNHGT
jgi:hypothetical protein